MTTPQQKTSFLFSKPSASTELKFPLSVRLDASSTITSSSTTIKYSLYRLIGDRPSNFTVERMGGESERTRSLAIASHGDVVYYLTAEGLHYFNGVDALPMPDMRRIKTLMSGALTGNSRMIAVGGKLYFTIVKSGVHLLAVYDIAERKYLLYGGFKPYDLCVYDGKAALISDTRRPCLWGRGGSFDGEPICAWWRTPLTDLGDRASIKTLRMLCLVGSGEACVTTNADGVPSRSLARLDGGGLVVEIPLKNEGRRFCFTIENSSGALSLTGGLQAELSVRKRAE